MTQQKHHILSIAGMAVQLYVVVRLAPPAAFPASLFNPHCHKTLFFDLRNVFSYTWP